VIASTRVLYIIKIVKFMSWNLEFILIPAFDLQFSTFEYHIEYSPPYKKIFSSITLKLEINKKMKNVRIFRNSLERRYLS